MGPCRARPDECVRSARIASCKCFIITPRRHILQGIGPRSWLATASSSSHNMHYAKCIRVRSGLSVSETATRSGSCTPLGVGESPFAATDNGSH